MKKLKFIKNITFMENKDFELFLSQIKVGGMPNTVGVSFYKHQIYEIEKYIATSKSDDMLNYFHCCIKNRSVGFLNPIIVIGNPLN